MPVEQVLVLAHQPQYGSPAVVHAAQVVYPGQWFGAPGAAVGCEGHRYAYQSQLTVGQNPTVGPESVPCSHLLFERHHPQMPSPFVTQV